MTLIQDKTPGCEGTKFVDDNSKTFLPRAENLAAGLWFCIEQVTQMNNPCSNTINHTKRNRNSSDKITLRLHWQIAFHHVLRLHQLDTESLDLDSKFKYNGKVI